MFENMILLIAKDDYENFKQDEALFKASEKYLNDYLDFFENREKEIKANLVSEEQILDFLSKDKDLTKSLKAHIDLTTCGAVFKFLLNLNCFIKNRAL